MNVDANESEARLPESVNAAVDCLLREIDPAVQKQIQRTPKESLRLYHHDWGPLLQQRFRLDGRNESLMDDCRRLYALRMRSRFAEFELEKLSETQLLMPRNSAFVVILEALWLRLQQRAEENAK
jgi:hypothetical protein